MSQGGAAAAGVKEVQSVQNEAGGVLQGEGLHLRLDGLGVHALLGPLGGFTDQQADAGGEAPRVDHIHAGDLLGSHDGVLVGHGQAGAQGDVDHVVPLIGEALEELLVFAHAHRAGLGKGARFLPILIDHVVGDVDAVQILPVVHGHVQRREGHVVPFLEHGADIAGGVRGDLDWSCHGSSSLVVKNHNIK